VGLFSSWFWVNDSCSLQILKPLLKILKLLIIKASYLKTSEFSGSLNFFITRPQTKTKAFYKVLLKTVKFILLKGPGGIFLEINIIIKFTI
jgi:hypothetical protein